MIVSEEELAKREEEAKKKKMEEKRKEVGFVERNTNKDFNIVYRNKPSKPMTVSELFGLKTPKKEETSVTTKKQEKVEEVNTKPEQNEKEVKVEKIENEKELKLETKKEERTETRKVNKVEVNMGSPILMANQIPVVADTEQVINQPLEVNGQTYLITAVSMGNPHAIVYMDDLDSLDIGTLGPRFENHIAFPDRINTEFVKVIDRHTLQMRVWERGAGETLACGTGACAVAVASTLNGLVEEDTPVTVKLLGGDLQILWNRQEDLVYMTGPAVTVFEGEIDLSFLGR